MTGWPLVPLSEVLQLQRRWVKLEPTNTYQEIGVRSFGNGIFHKPPVEGSVLGNKRVLLVEPGDLVFNNVFAWEGAVAVAGPEEAGMIGSHRFITYTVNPEKSTASFLKLFFSSKPGMEVLLKASPGSAGRNKTLGLERFIAQRIQLPSLIEQRQLVEHIEGLSERLKTIRTITTHNETQQQLLLLAAFRRIVEEAPHRRLGELAPLTRRPAAINPLQKYPQVSVRSFGKGSFHNPPLKGSEITWEKPHEVKYGDILVSNIKAWEGAIAVATEEDDGRFGSHRYLTYVPIPGTATARFLCFYLLTPTGLSYVGEASPGSADRNRTTSAKALLEIPVPLPNYERQLWFGELYSKMEMIRNLQCSTAAEREAMLPSLLNGAFGGGK